MFGGTNAMRSAEPIPSFFKCARISDAIVRHELRNKHQKIQNAGVEL